MIRFPKAAKCGPSSVFRCSLAAAGIVLSQAAHAQAQAETVELDRLIGGAALSVGSAVAVTGAIGFVGLVVPHLLRPLVGHRPGRLLLLSGFGGAILLLAADTALRLLPIRPELKLSVVTALVGAPFLFGLIHRLRRGA